MSTSKERRSHGPRSGPSGPLGADCRVVAVPTLTDGGIRLGPDLLQLGVECDQVGDLPGRDPAAGLPGDGVPRDRDEERAGSLCRVGRVQPLLDPAPTVTP